MHNIVFDFQYCLKGHGTAAVSTLLFKPGALLNEAHEWCDACAGTNHDGRVAGLEGQPELGLADVHRHSGLVPVVSRQFSLKPVGSNTPVDAVCLSLVLNHHGADVDAVRVNLSQEGTV